MSGGKTENTSTERERDGMLNGPDFDISRLSFQLRPRCYLRPPDYNKNDAFRDPNYPSHSGSLHPHHADTRSLSTFPLALALPAISAWDLYPEYSDSNHRASCIPHRCPPLRTAYGLGLVHCLGRYDLDCC